MNWVDSLNGALDYIEDNIRGEITVSSIAGRVYISGAHLQRCFHSMTGFTVGEYVRNRRLTLAGHELAVKRAKVIDVAMRYGYETPESFSKAFRRFHGVTPSHAKRGGANLKSYNRMSLKIIMEGGSVMDYRIEKKDAFKVVVYAKTFNDSNSVLVDASVNEVPAFWGEYFANAMHEKVCPDLGVCGESDSLKKTFRYGIGSFAKKVSVIPEGYEEWEIPANTWAVFRCVGAMPNAILDMWKRIYAEWLPQAKYELTPGYDFEYYTEGDNSSPDYVSEIWVPVKEK